MKDIPELKRVCCYVNDRIVTVKEYEREQVTQDNILLQNRREVVCVRRTCSDSYRGRGLCRK